MNPDIALCLWRIRGTLQPIYSGVIGTAWLEREELMLMRTSGRGGDSVLNGTLVQIKQNRQKVNNDMIAVSEDLIKRKVTSPTHLGISGRK